MSRLSRDQCFIQMAFTLAERATCPRRKVGCILVDEHGHVIGTGYNGVAAGVTHCIDKPCEGATYASGQGLDKCQAIHAEQNALLQCKDTQAIRTAYITAFPCVHCIKLFMNTGCQTLIVKEGYSGEVELTKLWVDSKPGRKIAYI